MNTMQAGANITVNQSGSLDIFMVCYRYSSICAE
jgi:hypothetical protein